MTISRVSCCCFGNGHATFLLFEMERGRYIRHLEEPRGSSYRLRLPLEKLLPRKLSTGRAQLLMNIRTLRGRARHEVLGARNRARAVKAAREARELRIRGKGFRRPRREASVWCAWWPESAFVGDARGRTRNFVQCNRFAPKLVISTQVPLLAHAT